MKKLHTLFENKTHNEIEAAVKELPNSKSEICRAAMNVGLMMISCASESMTRKELHNYIQSLQLPENHFSSES